MFELIGVAVGGTFALAGTIIGTIMTKKATDRQERRKMLVDCYADVFAKHYEFLSDQTPRSLAVLIASIERLRVICSDETDDVLSEFELTLSDFAEHPDMDVNTRKCGELMLKLRSQAKKEVR